LTFIHDSNDDSSKYVLVVDNELDLLNLMQRWLLIHGFKLCVFTEGLSALNHFSSNAKIHPIVICDIIGTSDITRHEFVTRLRQMNPKVRLIVTGYEEPTNIIPDTFIKKPFSVEEIGYIVQQYYQHEMAS
jgi:DNA-binding NtrC family response regulator